MFGSKPPPNPVSEEILDEIRSLSERVARLQGEKDSFTSVRSLERERQSLTEANEKLKVERDRKQEEHDRKVREVEHATGLLRKQAEWERKKAVDEARLAVREENLDAERTRFDEQMQFHQEQIKSEISRFEGLLTHLLDRLPTVTVEKAISLSDKRAAG